jgi:hypothetical protein
MFMLDGNYRKDYTTNSVPVMDLLPSIEEQ